MLIRAQVIKKIKRYQQKVKFITKGEQIDWQDIEYHDYDDNNQSRFDSVILDTRNDEGNRIQKLIQIVKQNGDIDPQEIVAFIKSISNHLITSCNLKINQTDPIYIYTARAIFPKINNFCCLNINSMQIKDLNSQFNSKKKLFLHYTPQDFGVLPKYCRAKNKENSDSDSDNNQAPFQNSIKTLDFLGLHTIPTDMLWEVARAISLLHKEALYNQISFKGKNIKDGLQNAEMLGADDIFPIMVYVVAQAEISDIYSCVHFMRSFSTERESKSELGYSLTTFSGKYLFYIYIYIYIFIYSIFIQNYFILFLKRRNNITWLLNYLFLQIFN
ncbi:vps9 domain-containing protein [Anaeramoeba flamelloides]|uniref:Vps9 domain-containing protein n=1 Tax=Anaeramoeba flamelloides TaxID=1746091 RepID=A0AAV7Z3G4_9EUKA|nr:vps9 domain-containing protein [Anaeramoeba flamelloides]